MDQVNRVPQPNLANRYKWVAIVLNCFVVISAYVNNFFSISGAGELGLGLVSMNDILNLEQSFPGVAGMIGNLRRGGITLLQAYKVVDIWCSFEGNTYIAGIFITMIAVFFILEVTNIVMMFLDRNINTICIAYTGIFGGIIILVVLMLASELADTDLGFFGFRMSVWGILCISLPFVVERLWVTYERYSVGAYVKPGIVSGRIATFDGNKMLNFLMENKISLGILVGSLILGNIISELVEYKLQYDSNDNVFFISIEYYFVAALAGICLGLAIIQAANENYLYLCFYAVLKTASSLFMRRNILRYYDMRGVIGLLWEIFVALVLFLVIICRLGNEYKIFKAFGAAVLMEFPIFSLAMNGKLFSFGYFKYVGFVEFLSIIACVVGWYMFQRHFYGYSPMGNWNPGVPGGGRNYPGPGMDYQNPGRNYPGQRPGYPNQRRNVPGRQPDYPNQRRNVPGQQSDYPNQRMNYPGQQPGSPNQRRNSPGQQPGYPNPGMNMPSQRPGYPNTGMNMPDQRPGYSNSGMNPPGQRPGYSNQEMNPPSQQPGYPDPRINAPGSGANYQNQRMNLPNGGTGYQNHGMGVPDQSTGAAKCPKCGRICSNGEIFCRQCGMRVK